MNNSALNFTPNQVLNTNLAFLKQGDSFTDQYDKVLKSIQGTLTGDYKDVINIFKQASMTLNPNEQQAEMMSLFRAEFERIQKTIDPERLSFSITRGTDDEICLNRKATSGGIVNLIIHEDGLIALSFIPSKSSMLDKYIGFVQPSNADYESLAYQFLGY